MEDLLNDPEIIKGFVDEIFNEFDTDKSGFIECSEMDNMMKKLKSEITQDNIKLPDSLSGSAQEVLKKFDTNQDGKLSREEMQALVKQVLQLAAQAAANE
mmetsp:Transcript_98918/g.137414  ORF Transcript_98918/g.137414 Transcript_98918/m.137414 type:complete len:100 (+) Transcript_98918:89-388(+)